MALLKSVGDFFGLDIGTSAVRVVQLSKDKTGKWELKHYGYASIDVGTAEASSSEARHRLGEVIMTVVGQSGIKTKNVAISLSAQKTFITVVDMAKVSDVELRSTIKYQVDEYIPMSSDEAKVDWAVLGQSLHDPSMQEVLLASVSNTYAEEALDFIEELGFDVIASEPEALAMIRSTANAMAKGAQMIIDVGELSSNIAIVYYDAPRLVRSIPVGLATLVRSATQNLSIEDAQARQFILKFGLAPDKLEGQVATALAATLDSFASEINKSIKFFQTRYSSAIVTNVTVLGYASRIPLFPEYIAQQTTIPTEPSDPWRNIIIPVGDERFTSVRDEFSTAVGLAQRSGK